MLSHFVDNFADFAERCRASCAREVLNALLPLTRMVEAVAVPPAMYIRSDVQRCIEVSAAAAKFDRDSDPRAQFTPRLLSRSPSRPSKDVGSSRRHLLGCVTTEFSQVHVTIHFSAYSRSTRLSLFVYHSRCILIFRSYAPSY